LAERGDIANMSRKTNFTGHRLKRNIGSNRQESDSITGAGITGAPRVG
jgi:hypothetical protein